MSTYTALERRSLVVHAALLGKQPHIFVIIS